MRDIQITDNFDSGNITVLSINGAEALLAIRPDCEAGYYQWFHFRVSDAGGRRLVLHLTGLNGSAYPGGWHGYAAVVSEDNDSWTRADTVFDEALDNGTLTICYRPRGAVVWVAYFAPYSMQRHRNIVSLTAAAAGVEHRSLGVSIDGQSIDCLEMGHGPFQVWLYGRQHPGETKAGWWMEGALALLTDMSSAVAIKLRECCRFHVVPNVNPDGSRRGHLRTNAAGTDLNRAWATPTLERSPEILAVRGAMDVSGVDFAIDVHGEEEIAAVFLDGFEGIPSLHPNKQAEFARYVTALSELTNDFQTDLGYPADLPGSADLTISNNQVAERYGAVAMTLEMPFKDHEPCSDPVHGWSPSRSKQLGRDCLAALLGWLENAEV